MREAWCSITVYDSIGRPCVLDGVQSTSEVALDTAAGGWWVRDEIRFGFLLLRSGWSEPYLITPGCDRDPHRDINRRMLADMEAMRSSLRR